MKINELTRQELEEQNSQQQGKHTKLYSDLLQTEKMEPFFSAWETLISVLAVPIHEINTFGTTYTY